MNEGTASRHVALQEAVQSWLQVKAEKAKTMKEYNDEIKLLEESIEKLSGRIEEDKHNRVLPFDGGDEEDHDGPRIHLDEAEIADGLTR